MKQELRMFKCPRCSSRNLQVADSTSDRETLICCLDCDATFERHQKGKERRKSKHDYDDDYGSQGKRR